MRRLAYTLLVDYVPGISPYDVETIVELHPTPQGVRMTLTIDAMHDEEWTRPAIAAWEMGLRNLAKVLER
jgi:hypothetical protein